MPMHMHTCLSNIYLSRVKVRQLSVPDSLGNGGRGGVGSVQLASSKRKAPLISSR
jgi:GTPase involved in cell partitioning and DNA repair